jgi:hypothetical protein
MHRVPGVRKPEGVRSGGSADVDHGGRRARRVPLDQLPGPYLLDHERALPETVLLGRPMIELGDGGIESGRWVFGHRDDLATV